MNALTLQQCKDKVAKKHHNLKWEHLNEFGQASYFDEVCELFAKQALIVAAEEADGSFTIHGMIQQSIIDTDLSKLL
ncbi:MAG: hypothetical protein K0S09_38 [Sphingobacteriaceae bacterium]|jgi:hypothetical protein|nr:hypothetical protein [Sphingobacteriaceae bacterium]